MPRGGKRPGAGRKPKHDRSTECRPEYARQAQSLCRLGATDLEIADFFGVSSSVLYRWRAESEEFSKALTSGKEMADDRVERALFSRAVGYTFESEKVFQFQGAIVRAPIREHVPPDTGAATLWLKNRRGEQWRDKQVVEHGGKVEHGADDALAELFAGLDAAARLKLGGGDSPSQVAEAGEAGADHPRRH